MAGGLLAGYGSMIAMALRFLYPSREKNVAWRFVATLHEFKNGDSIDYTAPSGATVVIATTAKSRRQAASSRSQMCVPIWAVTFTGKSKTTASFARVIMAPLIRSA